VRPGRVSIELTERLVEGAPRRLVERRVERCRDPITIAGVVQLDPVDLAAGIDRAGRSTREVGEELWEGIKPGATRVVLVDRPDRDALDTVDLEHADWVAAVAATRLHPAPGPATEGEGDLPRDEALVESLLEQQHRPRLYTFERRAATSTPRHRMGVLPPETRQDDATMKLVALTVSPLSVPLLDPFVIATATMTHTRAVLVEATVEREGMRASGLGEAAALPPVTTEDQPDLLAALEAIAPALVGASFEPSQIGDVVVSLGLGPVACGALECALEDAVARLEGVPLHRALGSAGPLPELVTDITLPIGDPGHLAALALAYRGRGFASFKVKVGKDRRSDRAVLTALARALPAARVRLDANEGYSADDALGLLDDASALGLDVECFEQPCSRHDAHALSRVTASSAVPIVADESCRSLADVDRIASEGLAHAVNLKLVKLGGVRASLAVGRRARELGLRLMAGAMVETRLGLSAMAHVVTALGGVDFLDLDTAFLLADDPFRGGYRSDGAKLELDGGAGLGVTRIG